MRRLHYVSGHVLVADQVCKATLRYARALAVANTAAVVSIPVVTDGGSLGIAHLLIGPASQIFSVPVEHPVADPVHDDTVAEFEARTRELDPSTPPWPTEMTDIRDWPTEFDVNI